MKALFTKITFSILLVGFGFMLNAQSTVVDESEISFDILKWHFEYYPHSVSKEWTVSKNIYEASFSYEGKNYKCIYDLDGDRMREEMELDEVPGALTEYLDSQYIKVKVIEFKKLTDFENNTVFYEAVVKSKDRGEETLNFDKDFIPVDFHVLSKAE